MNYMNEDSMKKFIDEVMININDIEGITLKLIENRDKDVDTFNDVYIINQKAHNIKRIYQTYIS